MSKSKIEWTTDTWNPVVGCSILSPGCTNCYAMNMAARIEAMNAEARETLRATGKVRTIATQYDGTTRRVNGHAVWTGKMALASDNVLLQPLKRKKPTTYFVNSMGDLFHKNAKREWIDKVFAVMTLTPQHIFQVLTKHAAEMRDYLNDDETTERIAAEAWVTWMQQVAPRDSGNLAMGVDRDDEGLKHPTFELSQWPLPNVWLGVSTERQQEADERIPLLLQTPAAIRFISAEPLLGAIDLTSIKIDFMPGYFGDALHPHHVPYCDRHHRYPNLDWVIVGGESGSDARPMHPDWARSLRVQCEAAGVPFFFKQWGEWIGFYDRDRDDPDWREIPKLDNQMGRGATRWHNFAGGIGFHGERLVAMRNVGKKAAGRALDGIEYNEMPACAKASAGRPGEPR